MTDKNATKDTIDQARVSNVKTSKESEVETTPPVPVQTNDDPRGHVGAQDQQVDHTLTPPAPEESVEKISH